MNVTSIILTILLAAVLYLAIRRIIKKKGSCGCCDKSCPGCRAGSDKDGKKEL